MRTYESYKLSRAYIFFTLGLLLVLALTSVYVFSGGLGTMRAKAPLPPPLLLIWCGFLVVMVFYCLRFPWEIRFLDDDTLEFRRVGGTKVISLREITAIEGMFLRPGYLKIKYTRGTIWLVSQMTGLYELIYLVKSRNPDVLIKDC
ncbi:MAG: hypothetical protein AB1424_02070 [Thermodesulfobacteriota bacterium]